MTLSTIFQFFANIALGVVIVMPLFLYPYLYFFQEQLLFHPRPMNLLAKQMLQKKFPHGEVRLKPFESLQLHGWFIHRPKQGQRPLLIYFGGNAEEVSAFLLDDAKAFPEWAILSMNYRGYGESQGKPGEKSLFSDALYIYDWASQQTDIDAKQIVVMGRSLGSGVAVHLAAERPVAGVVLVSPFDSIRRVAQGIYPYVPVSWLLKHPFDALSRAPAIRTPMFMLLAENDTIIPLPHSKRLANAWGGPHTSKLMTGQDHNSISFGSHYHESIQMFLDQTHPIGQAG